MKPFLSPRCLPLFIILFVNLIGINAAFADRQFPSGQQDVFISGKPGINSAPLANIAPLVDESIAQGFYPGAIILAAHNGQVIYRGVFGNRSIVPQTAPMQFNTIFDMASLTKVIVTTTAVMQLVDQGKLKLDAPVAKYWPAFAKNGKANVTVRQLLTHTSGFEPDIPGMESKWNQKIVPPRSWKGKTEALQRISNLKLVYIPDTQCVYSDINFITLGYLVEKISHLPLDQYAQKYIFKPLGMRDSSFIPAIKLRPRIAPTELMFQQLRWGVVQDPTTYTMGGIAGIAGLFSTANDLGIFAQTLLDKGRLPTKNTKQQKNNYLLKPATIAQMTTPQTPDRIPFKRGLGWDLDSPYSARGTVFSANSFGHTGWTGTSIWIDPDTQTWLVILTSRTHPTPAKANKLIVDRRDIADMVAEAVKS